QRYGQPPLTVYRGNVSGMPKDLKEADIVKIVNDGIVPRLDDLDLARDYNAGQLQKHYRTNTEVPYTYIKDIDFPTMAKFSEHDVGLPGVDIAIKPVRSYVYGALAAHLLGYVGPPDDTNKEEAGKFTFYQSDVDGKSNIEKIFDQYLRGRPGVRYLRRNAKGVIDGVLREDPPMQGANVYLTIDARIQAIAEEAIRSVARGAAVVVDPNNGDVLAMVSVPSFDPNTFIPSIKAKDWAALQKDEARPLINRAISVGKESGIHITGEQPGIMPGPEWMAIHYPRERWSQAYTANVSIGQGYVLASPLQMAMAYATVANGGVSYYPRLVSKILNQNGSIALDENGKPAVPAEPRIDSDLRLDFSPEQIEMVRRGLWEVVNEDGGTGGRARLKGVQVAGKTGTAQASTNGKKDTIAWFCCFAPFDQPKYVVVAMVQGGEHGGSVAAPIATRILERTLAMDAGTFEPQVAWLAPAHHSNPFAMVKDITFKDTEPNASTDEEHGDDSQTADTQMAAAGDDPDVEQAPDAQGQVSKRQTRVARALPVATPPEKRGFFQRLFGGHRNPPAAIPTPAPTPSRRSRGF